VGEACEIWFIPVFFVWCYRIAKYTCKLLYIGVHVLQPGSWFMLVSVLGNIHSVRSISASTVLTH